MMADLFALIGPPSKIIPPGSRVLIKVNLTSEEKLWDKGILTSPLFTRALVEEVQKARPAEVIIAEGTAVGQDTKKAFAANGYPEVAKATGARLLDLYDGEHEEVKTCPGRNFKNRQNFQRGPEGGFLHQRPGFENPFCQHPHRGHEEPERHDYVR